MTITLGQLEQLLMWCSIVNMGLMAFVLACMLTFRAKIVGIHSKLFGIPEERIKVAIYSSFGLWKLLTFVFFVIPWACLHFMKVQ